MTWAIFSNSHVKGIGEMLTSGSERVLAVVGGALLEDTIHRTLSERLQDKPDVVKNLLEVDRPLGNTAPQIDLLYLLYGIESDTRTALKAVAHIRNRFAHDLDMSFDSEDKDFVKEIEKLNLHKGKTYYPHHLGGGESAYKIEEVTNRRERFTVNLKLGLIALMRDRLSHKPHSNEALTKEEIEAYKMKVESRGRPVETTYLSSG